METANGGVNRGADATPALPNGSRNGERGRGRARGEGRGRGRGSQQRGGRGGHMGSQSHTQAPQNPMTAGDLAARFAQNAIPSIQKQSKKQLVEPSEADDAEVCFICATPVVYESVAPCNHRICHICSLRMRALYKDQNCAHCRTPAPSVIFTSNKAKRWEEFSPADIKASDDNIGIRYDEENIRDDTVVLLRYNCPDPECDVACLGWPDLHRHVKAAHHKKICDLCSRHKKVFTHEHDLFTDSELHRHMRKGDDNPGAVDQTGFKGHPLCTFCAQRFYGEDELYLHCKEKHERCFICDKRNAEAGRQPVYFNNTETLIEHFREDHYPCTDRECLEKKLIVFPSEFELKAHIVEEHGESLSKDVRRDARMVDLTNFELRTRYVEPRRGGGTQREQRDGRGATRGRGRGRDPNAEPLPPSSAQPLRRDEQAFQRQMAIHSAQSVTTRNFGGQLTAPTPAQARPQAMSVPRPSARTEAVAEELEHLNTAQQDLSPQDQARQLRHSSVIERAELLLHGDKTKMSQFRNSISSFKNNALTGKNLIDSFFALFTETDSKHLGTLIREVAELYEEPKKSEELRTEWNNWRAINEDYPSLPAAGGSSSSSIPLNWAVSSSSTTAPKHNTSAPKSTRVLKLKSSTAQSSRSTVSQARSWGSASSAAGETAASSSTHAFPGLPPAGRGAVSNNSKVQTIPWGSAANTPRPTPPTSRPSSTAPRGDAFPALPKAAKPQSSIMSYGNGRMVRRDGGTGFGGSAPALSAWNGGEGSASGNGMGTGEDGGETEDGGKGKGKGRQGKKKVLIGWG